MRLFLRQIGLLAMLFMAAVTVMAQTHYVSVSDGNWASPVVWSPNGVPGSTDTVTVSPGQSVFITANQSVHTIVLQTGGYLNVNGSSQLDVTGDWLNDGVLEWSSGLIAFTAGQSHVIAGMGTNFWRLDIQGVTQVFAPFTTDSLTTVADSLLLYAQWEAYGPVHINSFMGGTGPIYFYGWDAAVTNDGEVQVPVYIYSATYLDGTGTWKDMVAGSEMNLYLLSDLNFMSANVEIESSVEFNGFNVNLDNSNLTVTGSFNNAGSSALRTTGTSTVTNLFGSISTELDVLSGTTTFNGNMNYGVTVRSGATLLLAGNMGISEWLVVESTAVIEGSEFQIFLSAGEGGAITNNGIINAYLYLYTSVSIVGNGSWATLDIPQFYTASINDNLEMHNILLQIGGDFNINMDSVSIIDGSIYLIGGSISSGKLRLLNSSFSDGGTVNCDFDIVSGNCEFSGSGSLNGTLSVRSGATLTIGGDTGFNLYGDVTIDPSATVTGFSNLTAPYSGQKFINNGVVEVTIDFDQGEFGELGGDGQWTSIRIGSVMGMTLLDTLIVAWGNLTIDGTLDLLSYDLILQDSYITMGSTGSLLGGGLIVTIGNSAIDNEVGGSVTASLKVQEILTYNGHFDGATVELTHIGANLIGWAMYCGASQVYNQGWIDFGDAFYLDRAGSTEYYDLGGHLGRTSIEPPATLILPSDVTIHGELVVNGGNLDIQNWRLIVDSPYPVHVQGGGVITRTSGYVAGGLRQAITSPGLIDYPVGSPNGYSPVTFNVTQLFAGDYVMVRPVETVPPDVGKPAEFLKRNWVITPTINFNANFNLTFHYRDVDFNTGLQEHTADEQNMILGNYFGEWGYPGTPTRDTTGAGGWVTTDIMTAGDLSTFGFGKNASSFLSTLGGGHVTSDTTWTTGTIHVGGDVFIDDGNTLTIQPGTTVAMDGWYKIDVKGRIIALGKPDSLVTFTRSDTGGFSDTGIPDGGWHGIRFFETPATNDTSVLDFCKLEFGKAIGAYPENTGGAIFADNGNTTNRWLVRVTNSIIENNYAQSGAGIYVRTPGGNDFNRVGVKMIGNAIRNNIAGNTGGGIYSDHANTVIENNRIEFNAAGYGGGLAELGNGTPQIVNNLINGNHADDSGVGNQQGGGIYCQGTWFSVKYANNTIVNNTAEYGGAVAMGSSAMPSFYNNIVWGNWATIAGTQFYNNYTGWSQQTFAYNNIQGGMANFGLGQPFGGTYAESNIDTDPFFLGSGNDPFQLGNDQSPCINGGSTAISGLVLPATDLLGHARIYDGAFIDKVDMGAYEFQGDPEGLSGTYVIGPGGDYPTIRAAVDHLNAVQVTGPVTFNMASGTYVEQIAIDTIRSAEGGNSVTFQSATGVVSDVTWRYASNQADSNWVVSIIRGDFVGFRNLTFVADDPSYGRIVHVGENVSALGFENCIFNGIPTAGIGNSHSMVFGDQAVGMGALIVQHCIFGYGSRGIDISNPTDSMDAVLIMGCQFNNQSEYGLLMDGSYGIWVEDNLIRSSAETYQSSVSVSRLSVQPGGVSEYPWVSSITKNHIEIGEGTGIRLSGTDSPNLIGNNFITVGGNSSGQFYGVDLINTPNQMIYFSSIHVTSNDLLNSAVVRTDAASQQLDVQNSLLVHSGGGHVYELNNASALTGSDHNDLYSTGSELAVWEGIPYSDLISWQGASGYDMSSFSIDPGFVTSTDLHIENAALDGMASEINGIFNDIDGDARDEMNPDIGADEYVLMPPVVPTGLTSHALVDSVVLHWNPNTEPDLGYYIMYRSTISEFTPTRADSIARIDKQDTMFVDSTVMIGEEYYYVLTALDQWGNESGFSGEEYAFVSPMVIAEGHIPFNTTWASDTVHVVGDVFIDNGITLTIRPGVYVAFEGWYKIDVNGRLLAAGNFDSIITFTRSDTTGFHNTTITDGGWHGIRFFETPPSNDTSRIDYCTLEYGKAIGSYPEDCGGAIYADNGNTSNRWLVAITNSFIRRNYATRGAGIYLYTPGGNDFNRTGIRVINNRIEENTAGYSGGGIHTDHTDPTIVNNDIGNNRAQYGGGIYVNGNGVPKISNNVIHDNHADDAGAGNQQGGGIYFQSTWWSIKVANNTIVNNTAEYGGGVSLANQGQPSFYNNILYGNLATLSGAQMYVDYTAQESQIFDHNNIQGRLTEFGFGTSFGGTYLGTNFDAYPEFTMEPGHPYAVADFSPCVNTGTGSIGGLNLPAVDLKGNLRVYAGSQTRVDVGAYELQTDPSWLSFAIGSLNADVVWSSDTVGVLGEVIVPSGMALTVQAGTVVGMAVGNDYLYSGGVDAGMLRVDGRLMAVGTENDPIYFIPAGEGYWGSIVFTSTADPTGRMAYCRLEYGSGIDSVDNLFNADGMIAFYHSGIVIDHCMLLTDDRANIWGEQATMTMEYSRVMRGYLSEAVVLSAGSNVSLLRCEFIESFMVFQDASSGVIDHCSFFSDGGEDPFVRSESGSTVTITNSAMSPIGTPIDQNGGTVNVSYSMVDDGGEPYPGAGNIAGDPSYVNPSVSDLHLNSDSPCIDAADPLSGVVDSGGLRADMGAFEYFGYTVQHYVGDVGYYGFGRSKVEVNVTSDNVDSLRITMYDSPHPQAEPYMIDRYFEAQTRGGWLTGDLSFTFEESDTAGRGWGDRLAMYSNVEGWMNYGGFLSGNTITVSGTSDFYADWILGWNDIEPPTAPFFTSVPVTSVLTDQSYNYGFSSLDVNGDPLYIASVAAESVDQELSSSDMATLGTDQWQSFTSGQTGLLTRIEWHTNGFSSGPQPFTFTVYSGEGTGGPVLYTGSSAFDTPSAEWFSVIIPDSLAPWVYTENVYTIRFQFGGTYDQMSANGTDPYGGGIYYSDVYGLQPSWDVNFRTYVRLTGVLPPFLTIDDYGDGSGELYGTPLWSDVGSYPISLMVSDGMRHGFQDFVLDVLPGSPPAPTGLWAEAGNQQAKLSWEKSTDASVVKYRIYRRQGLSYNAIDSTLSVDDTTQTITGLNNDSLYHLVVTAVNGLEQESPYSNEEGIVPVVESGRALSCDGIDDFVGIPPSANLALSMFDDFTISAWIKRVVNDNMTVFHQPWSEVATLQIWCWINDSGVPVFGTDNFSAGGWDMDFGNSVVPINEWTHVAFVKNGSSKHIYINGRLDKTAPVINSAGASAPSGGMNIGWSVSSYFHGFIDEVQVWKAPLSDPEINANLIRPARGDESGLVGVWHMDEPQDQGTAYDGSRFGHDAAVVGDAASVHSGAMSPLAPARVYAVSGNQKIELLWNSNDELDFLKYYVYGDVNPNPTTLLDSTSGGDPQDTTVTITGLVNGQLYYFRVAGADSAGQIGSYSNDDAVVPVVEAGNAVSLDGVVAYVDAGGTSAFDLTGDLTVEAWFYINAMPTDNWVRVVGKSGALITDPRTFGLWYHSNGTILFQTSANATSGAYVVTTGQWYHLAGVNSGGNLTLYLNGEVVATGTGAPQSSVGPLLIGGAPFHALHNGLIDEARIWNVVRTGDEIRGSLHRPLRGDEYGLVGLFHFDEPLGPATYDATPNALNGVMAYGASPVLSTAMAPLAPKGLTAYAGNSRVDLKWNANFEPDIAKYYVYQGLAPNPTTLVDSTSSGLDTTIGLVGLTNGTLYYYRVAALDSSGRIGVYSNEDAAVPVVEAGNAVSLADGQYMTLGYQPALDFGNGDFTMEMWIKPASLSGSQYLIHNRGWIPDCSTPFFTLAMEGSQLTFAIGAYNCYFPYSPPSLVAGQWQHIAVTRGANRTLTYYINGVPTVYSDLSGFDGNFYTGNSVDIGRWVDYWAGQFFGEMDEIRIWNLARSAPQIQNSMVKPLSSADTGLVAYFRLDEGSGTTAYNGAGSFNGTLVGSPAWTSSGAMAPSMPMGLAAQNFAPDSVVVSWNSNSEADLAYYVVYRSTVDGFIPTGADSVGKVDKPATQFVDVTNLIIGETLYYRLAAFDSANQTSPWSAQASVFLADLNPLLVKNANDFGVGSLRNAIDSANTWTGPDTIRFANPGMIGQTITLMSSLNLGDDFTVIDGDIDGNNQPSVTIHAGVMGFHGLHLLSSGNTIKHVNMTGFRETNTAAIFSQNNFDNRIVGCYLGTNLAGTDTLGTGNFIGVWLFNSQNNVIGDSVPAGRNIISGNARGIAITSNAQGNWILGNYIGTDVSGANALGNTNWGIELSSVAFGNRIGYWNTTGRNVISGSTLMGVYLAPGSDYNEIINNYIGTDAAGNSPIPNGTGIAIYSQNNAIGWPGAGNLISGNTNAGIDMIGTRLTGLYGNIIGLDAAGATAIPNGVGIQMTNTDSNAIGGSTAPERNIISGNTNGIMMLNAPHTIIVGNYVGTDIGGTLPIAGTQHGIWIQGGMNHGVGDGTPGGRNIISGNTWGLRVTGSDSTSILGNYIGLDQSGTSAVPNGTGMHIDYSTHTLIGDGSAAGRNIISGNSTGIYFYSSLINGLTSDNWIKGNFIGTDVSGTAAVPNGYGILIQDRVRKNFFGDGTAGGRNVISGNSSTGVSIWASQEQGDNVFNGNYVGLDVSGNALGNAVGFEFTNGASGDTLIGNTIAYNMGPGVRFDGINTDSNVVAANSMHHNGSGIEIVNGAQGGVLPPVITAILYDSTVTGTASPFALVHIYADSLNEGEHYLDSIHAGSDGSWARKVPLWPAMGITATQTVNRSSSAFTTAFKPIIGTLAATPPSLDFGSVAVGDSVTLMFKLYAATGGVIVNTVTFWNGSYSLSGLVLPDTLFEGDTIAVSVRLKASHFGAIPDTIYLVNNSSISPFKMSLSAYGVSGTLASTPASLNYGNVVWGDSVQQIVQIYSNGGAVDLTSFTLQTGTDFRIDSTTGPPTLFTGDTSLVHLTYKPNSFGAHSDVLEIANNSGVNPFAITLSGTGTGGVLATNLPNVNFGVVPVLDSAKVTLELFAPHGYVLVNSAALLSGSQFQLVSLGVMPTALGPGDTLKFEAKFLPTFVGTMFDSMIVSTNAQNAPFGVRFDGTSRVPQVVAVRDTLYVVEDAKVMEQQPATNFGAIGDIYVYGSNAGGAGGYPNNQSKAYVKFNLSAIPLSATIQSATLKVSSPNGFAFNYDPNHYAFFVASDAWTEGAITWNTRPTQGTLLGQWFAWANGLNNWVYTTSTELMRAQVATERGGDGVLSMAISNETGAYYHYYYSKEGAPDSNRMVQLIVDYLPATLATLTPVNNLGTTQAGDSLQITLKIFATAGTVDITAASLQLGAEFSYNVIGGLPRTLTATPGDTLYIDVKFKPGTFGSYSDVLSLTNNAGVNPFDITLQGTGAVGNLLSDVSSINFPNVQAGDSAQAVVKVYTSGSVALTSSALDFGNEFTISNSLGLPVTLDPGDTLSVDVKFKPTTLGSYVDTIRVANNSSVNPLVVTLSGSTAIGTLLSDVSSVDLPNVQAGDSAEAIVKVYTSGSVDVSSSVLNFGAEFTITNSVGLPVTLDPGDTLSIDVKFKPTTLGSYVDTIRVANNSGVNPLEVTLSGSTAIGTLFSDVSSVDLPNVQSGDSAEAVVKVYTSGSVNLTVSALDLGNEFTITNSIGLPVTLDPGDTLLIDVKFKPTTLGNYVDTIRVANNSGVNPLVVTLSGSAAAGTLISDVTLLDLGGVQVGDSAQGLVKVYTSGSVAVTASTIDFGSHFTMTNSLAFPDTLNPGDTLFVDVTFKPTTIVSYSDTIRIANNSSVNPLTITLTGTGAIGTLLADASGYDFGSVQVGDSLQTAFRLYTSGSVAIANASLSFGVNYSIQPSLVLPDTLNPGDTLVVVTTFRPTIFGALSDTIVVDNNTGETPLRVVLDGTGAIGTLATLLPVVDFGNVEVEDSALATVKLYTATGSVALSGLSIVGGTQFHILSSVSLPDTLFPGDTLAVDVQFKPLVDGSLSDTLKFVNNSSVTPFEIPMQGFGSVGTLFALTPDVDFGSVQIGDSAALDVKLYGSTGGIVVTNSTLDFGTHFTARSLNTLPDTLSLGDTLTLRVVFRPVTFGTLSDTARVINNSLVNVLPLSLSGSGAVGTLASSSIQLNLGIVQIGDSTSRQVRFYTSLGAVLTDSLSIVTGTDFYVRDLVIVPAASKERGGVDEVVTNKRLGSKIMKTGQGDDGSLLLAGLTSLPDTLFPGDTLLVEVVFAPTEFLTRLDTLKIYNNSAQSIYDVALSGIGNTGTLAATPASIDFGGVLVGDSAQAQIQLYTTMGSVNLVSAALEVGADYQVSGLTVPTTIGAGDTVVVTVRFRPTVFAVSEDRLIIGNNSLINPFNLSFTGEGTGGTLAVTPASVSMGSVLVGDSATQVIRVYAQSGQAIVNSFSLDQGLVFTMTTGALPDTLMSGDTLDVVITFQPNTVGGVTDTLSVFSNVTALPLRVSLSGTGEAGTLMVSVDSLNYNIVEVGSSAVQRVLVYAVTGEVVMTNATFGQSGGFDLATAVTFPATLRAGIDTLAFDVRFRPLTETFFHDTLTLANNSPTGALRVKLLGTGYSNTAPNVFTLKNLRNNNLINTVIGDTLQWQNTGDADGDTLSYVIEISRSATFAGVDQTLLSTDSTVVITTALDSNAIYFWRVMAQDGKGGQAMSDTGVFRVDATNPELYVGILGSTILKNYLNIYAYSTEPLSNVQTDFVFTDTLGAQDSVRVAMNTVSETRGLYNATYKIVQPGSLLIRVLGIDSAGNTSSETRTYTVAPITPALALSIRSDDGRMWVTGERGLSSETGYLLLRQIGEATHLPEAMTKVIGVFASSEAKERWTSLGRYELLSTVSLNANKRLTLRFSYTQEDVAGLQALYPDFDERKLGVYREESGGWVYAGGEGRSFEVSAKTGVMGRVGVWYNPEHVYLPEKLELLQNYPNPFNPTTTIKFGLPQEGRVKLVVYNVLGQKVKELLRESREAGYHEVRWDGRSSTGHRVSSGLYIYRLETPMGVVSRKMMMVK